MKKLSAHFILCRTYAIEPKISGKLLDMKTVKRGRQPMQHCEMWPEASCANGLLSATVFRFSTQIPFDQGLTIPQPTFCQTASHMNQAGGSWPQFVPARHKQPGELRYDEIEIFC